MNRWRLISTLPDHSGTDIVLWNPCDGMHLLGFIAGVGEIEEIRRAKIFTHWQRLKPPKAL